LYNIFFKDGDINMKNDKALHMKLDAKLYNELKRTADNMHLSLASVVRMACSQWLRDYGKVSGDVSLDAIWDALPSVER